MSAAFLLAALGLNWFVFTSDVFPFVPDPFSGGKATIVKIEFAAEVPESAKIGFELRQPELYSTPQYYGQLIYMDEHSVFLKEAAWYARDVYEFQRDQIRVLRYDFYNPLEMGMPKHPK